MNTSALAEAPECGCTLAKAQHEQSCHPLDRQPLGDIDELAAPVIALALQAFGIFVGEDRALRFEHSAADDIFGRDQFDFVALAAEFALDRVSDLRIGLGKRGGEKIPVRGTGFMGYRHTALPC